MRGLRASRPCWCSLHTPAPFPPPPPHSLLASDPTLLACRAGWPPAVLPPAASTSTCALDCVPCFRPGLCPSADSSGAGPPQVWEESCRGQVLQVDPFQPWQEMAAQLVGLPKQPTLQASRCSQDPRARPAFELMLCG